MNSRFGGSGSRAVKEFADLGAGFTGFMDYGATAWVDYLIMQCS